MIQAYEYVKHVRKVNEAKALNLYSWNVEEEGRDEESNKKRKAQHIKTTEDFWKQNDQPGTIELLNAKVLTQQWAEYEKGKKAKATDGDKNDGKKQKGEQSTSPSPPKASEAIAENDDDAKTLSRHPSPASDIGEFESQLR